MERVAEYVPNPEGNRVQTVPTGAFPELDDKIRNLERRRVIAEGYPLPLNHEFPSHNNRPLEAEQEVVVADLKGIKLSIPSFSGSNTVYAYLDWERKLVLFFQCGNYTETQKVLLVTCKFTDYAAVWWEKVQL
ncbi:unnamed protein product [Linum trigynum]|uniref:Uncharacterized protein n=1 Tax=Linum trigynum TaxID=586398 RepID=A0AAV2GRH1_9ROSI